MKSNKETLLEALRQKIHSVQDIFSSELEKIGVVAFRPMSEINRLRKEDRELALFLKGKAVQRYEEIEALKKSPFFARCLISHKSTDVRQRKEKEIYFGKYEFSEKNIYSWVAPIAVIRFGSVGDAKFKIPNGQTREVDIKEKDQYMIVDGKVVFYSRETKDAPRELIYQEHFSIKKGAFVLPEIVEVMEKAQDDVIRAHHIGPFAIAGPAGSGKTTLALHRVAYLAQSPETMDLYPHESIIVFVQDAGTKEYFSHLLPELGIHNVQITTFFEWAKEIFGIEKISYEKESVCELEKLTIKNSISINGIFKEGSLPIWRRDMFSTLESLYNKGSVTLRKAFAEQKSRGVVDRIDLTLALMILKKHTGDLEIHKETNRAMRMGRIVKHRQVTKVKYPLIVVDEFQNYMPEQLKILNSCLNESTKSIIYVGDMSQQIRHGTVKKWEQFDTNISSERKIQLHKVYRNTRQILRYIQDLGYKVEIPEGLKDGVDVVEKQFDPEKARLDTLAYVDNLAEEIKKGGGGKSLGIIAMSSQGVDYIKEHIIKKEYKNIKALTIAEAQGVEFDVVCIVGIQRDIFDLPSEYNERSEFASEKISIYKDMMYIALTRAMSAMHILGTCKLSEALNRLS